MNKRLQEAQEQLRNDFGKMTRWELLCKEQNVSNEADQLRLAQQVLTEPMTKTVADWYSCWAKLYGISSPRLEQLVQELNMAKLLHFQRLCKERNATTDLDQIKIAEELLSWGPLDTIGASHSAWVRLKGAKPRKAPPYKPTGY